MNRNDFSDGPSQNILSREPTVLSVPWEPAKFVAVKGIVLHPPETIPILKRESRDAILKAIATSRLWLDELVRDQASVADIARREGKIERHVRLPLPLAFVSPAMVRAIACGSAPTHLTVTGLAKRVPYSWVQQ
jgi:site-specific DNA recombinase